MESAIQNDCMIKPEKNTIPKGPWIFQILVKFKLGKSPLSVERWTATVDGPLKVVSPVSLYY